ncbi:MAG: hypothetical protein SGJ02_08170 [bacterium]|nr:hypothetical protein [bacterium]
MNECTADDITEVLKKAPNVNSAIKNFLKREVKKGDSSEKFVKSLRDVLLSKNETAARDFISGALPKFLNHIYSIACYAYFESMSKLAENIVEKYADDFNATFEIIEGKVKYKDEKKFKVISSEALKIIHETLAAQGFAESAFMKNVALISVFERPVIDVLTDQLK